MRSLNRNETTIYYALYDGKTEEVDANNLYTGVVVAAYETPVALRASVSAARGTSEIDLFGVNTNYTKTVIVDDTSCPIDEHSRLWINTTPTNPHNYEVVSVARSLNHITYAAKQVDFSNAE